MLGLEGAGFVVGEYGRVYVDMMEYLQYVHDKSAMD
jgi:hypothetical protein